MQTILAVFLPEALGFSHRKNSSYDGMTKLISSNSFIGFGRKLLQTQTNFEISIKIISHYNNSTKMPRLNSAQRNQAIGMLRCG